MSPVVPVLITVAKVAGTALAIKSVAEGLTEGNLMKAALGGLGAYMGLSSLGAFGTQAASLGTGAGDLAAGAAADSTAAAELFGNAGSSLGTEAAASAVQNAATSAVDNIALGLNGAGGAASESLIGFGGSGASSLSAANTLGTAASGSSGLVNNLLGGKGGNLLGDVTGFIEDNPETTKLIGGMAEGYAQGEREEAVMDWKTDREERGYEREDQSRARTGAQARSPSDLQTFLNQYASSLFKNAYKPQGA